MGTNKNEINNNIIKLLFTVAFSVFLQERRLSYPEFQPYAFPHCLSSNHYF